MAINFAHCCYPIPGDEVTGVLTSSKGLVMHRSTCSNLEHIKEKNAVCLGEVGRPHYPVNDKVWRFAIS